MSAKTAGISTLGVKVGYAVESTAGTKPTAFTQLERVNSIGGITLDTEQIDASALEDEISRYVSGRQDTGGTWTLTFNMTNEVVTELETMITAYKGIRDSDKKMWFVVWSPFLEKSFFVVAQPPVNIPVPELSQNELQTVELSLTIEEYKGMDEAIEPTAA